MGYSRTGELRRGCALMGEHDGTVIGTTKILDHGPDASCYNIVLIAEGYREAELPTFESDCQSFVNRLNATRPFNDCNSGINVHRINISSTGSGADDPHTDTCNGAGTTADTYLDASFCAAGLERLMSFNNALAIRVLNAQVPQWHKALIIVNTPKFGGGGGRIAITSRTGNWLDVAMHEFGHGFGLADEYEYWSWCTSDDASHNRHSAAEPASPNVTVASSRDRVKWRSQILATTPVPTTANADCTLCDPQPNPMPAGTVGLYEGGHYCHCGVYRPAFDCMMRNLTQFCPVCQAAIRRALTPFAQQADLAITPWGYAQEPPREPMWQTPDIWGDPVVGRPDNELHVRVHNLGNRMSGPYTVRLSFVPYTTVIDLANEILITEEARPPLGPAPAIDEFVVNWDLSPAALPAEYAGINHFCVLATINAVECNTTNNSAQNNFVNVPTGPMGPPPLYVQIANPWKEYATAKFTVELSDKRVILKCPEIQEGTIKMKPGERRTIKLEFFIPKEARPVLLKNGISFRITQQLNGQTLGGICGMLRPEEAIKIPVKTPTKDDIRINR